MSESQLAEELPSSLAALIAEVEPGDKSTDADATKQTETPPADEPKSDPLVEKASKSGWTDKDAWVAAGKDPDEWVDAKEFIARKPLYDRIHKQERAIRERDERIEAVSKYAANAAKAEREKVLAEIDAEKRQAFESGDYDALKAAERKEREVLAEPQQQAPQSAEPKPVEAPPEVKDFAKRNEHWFEKDKDMTDFAVAKVEGYVRGEGMALNDALKKADEDVRRVFSHKFANPNKDKPSAVAPNNRETRSRSISPSDLNAEQRTVWASLKKVMPFDEFVAGLRAQGELK